MLGQIFHPAGKAGWFADLYFWKHGREMSKKELRRFLK